MKKIYDILLFILANAIGFMSTSITYHASVLSGRFPTEIIETDPAAFNSAFFTGTMLTWICCAVVSFGFFTIRSKWRFLFLLIPALLPIAYGLSVLNEFAALPLPAS
jgi:hypothetical protein